jgi:hypothetical protein
MYETISFSNVYRPFCIIFEQENFLKSFCELTGNCFVLQFKIKTKQNKMSIFCKCQNSENNSATNMQNII